MTFLRDNYRTLAVGMFAGFVVLVLAIGLVEVSNVSAFKGAVSISIAGTIAVMVVPSQLVYLLRVAELWKRIAAFVAWLLALVLSVVVSWFYVMAIGLGNY